MRPSVALRYTAIISFLIIQPIETTRRMTCLDQQFTSRYNDAEFPAWKKRQFRDHAPYKKNWGHR